MTDGKLSGFRLIRWEELPAIELYLDQVLIILDDALENITPSGEKVITSTIINNYVKQKVILPTVKKKYSREHITDLIMITILKRVLSTAEIVLVLKDLKEGRSAGEAYGLFCAELERHICAPGESSEGTDCPELSLLAVKMVTNKIIFDFLAEELEKRHES